jgi:SAM-dependent methyltransferase
VLVEHSHLLPREGTALDLACGRGGNALFLARRGFVVTARDQSAAAVEELQRAAESEALPLVTAVADVESLPWPPGCFDVIVVSRFLCRRLAPVISDHLSEGGLLFYQTYTTGKPEFVGPKNPEYLLLPNELLLLFGDLELRYYREDSTCGDLALGRRSEAYFVGQKIRPTFRQPRRSDP